MIQDTSLPPSVAEESNHDGRLSTIPEEDSLDIQSDDTYFAGVYLSGDEPAFEEKLTHALTDANFWCNASSLEPDENHVLHSCLDATSRKDVHPCLDAISRKDHGWEDKLLVDGFPNVPYLPPLETHADTISNYHVIAANLRAGRARWHLGASPAVVVVVAVITCVDSQAIYSKHCGAGLDLLPNYLAKWLGYLLQVLHSLVSGG